MPRALPARLARACLFAGVAVLLAGCGREAARPGGRNLPPETEITFAPVQNDTVSFRVHFHWTGHDADGEVVAFRWIVDPDPAVEKSPRTWRRTAAHDTTLQLAVDPIAPAKAHVFMVAAEDNTGWIDPTPAVRYFSATTVPPASCCSDSRSASSGTGRRRMCSSTPSRT